jgi:succinate dehydrogenase / fumarate reductase iron-sulfur subunit
MATALNYIGPAALAATHHDGLHRDPALLDRLDSDTGVWRCHNTFECSAVCPCGDDPARRIMHLRRQVVGQRLKRLFSREKEVTR